MKIRTKISLILFFLCHLLPALGEESPKLLVSPDWLREHLDSVTVIHIGSDQDEYRSAHIAGAVYADWSDLITTRQGVPNELPQRDQLEKLWRRLGVPDKGKIVVYDNGSGLPAARAFVTFDWLGHGERVAVLDGGLKAWERRGHAITDVLPTVTEGSFRAHSNDSVVITTEDLANVLNSPSSHVFDARPSSQYEGVEAGEGIERPGHIPGANNIFWQQHLNDEGMLKSPSELKKLYPQVSSTDTLVTYCRTGVQASHSYFVLKYLGFNPKLYDGSYYSWSKSDNPIEKDGMIIYSSPYSFAQTAKRLLEVLKETGLNLMAQVDHAANAEQVGKSLPPTRLYIFGNPKIGTDLMTSNRQTAIDLPQKVLLWQDGDRVNLAYNSPHYLAQRHHLDKKSPAFEKIAKALRALSEETVKIDVF